MRRKTSSWLARLRERVYWAWTEVSPLYLVRGRRWSLAWVPQDLWIGAYWKWASPTRRRWYVCLLPTLVVIMWERRA